MRRAKKRQDAVSFQITPMIDMTFLLLIFFMVTSKLSKEQIKLDIDLPFARSAVTPDDLSNRDIINIDENGLFYVRNDLVSNEELADYLKTRFENFPPLRLYVRADRETPAKQIKEVMRLAAEAGAVDVIIGSYQK
ncbi:MAG: biopolymer transporter ExbD [Verrucomicrobiota bacterium]